MDGLAGVAADMIKDVANRRDCPCKSVVEIKAELSGRLQEVRADIRLITHDITAHKDAFQAMKGELRECLEQLEEGIGMLRDGSHKFQSIDKDMARDKRHKNFMWAALAVLGLSMLLSGNGKAIAEAIKVIF